MIEPIDQLVIRSIYHAIRKEVVRLGYYPDVDELGDTEADVEDFKRRWDGIVNTKKFAIGIFSESSARNKGKKDAPRIVIQLGRTLPGNLGGAMGMYVPQEDGTYNRESMPSQSTDIMFEIYLVSATSEQHYLLNAIKDNVLGQRSFIPVYNDCNAAPFIAEYVSYYDTDDPMENIIEKGYVYIVPDAFVGRNRIERSNISPIKEIKVDMPDVKDKLQIP